MEPIILKDGLTGRFSDAEFFQFCLENKDLRIERNHNLEIIIMSPTGSKTGLVNNEISRQLANWNFKFKTGKTFDSSSGFTLPDQSVLSPDSSWVSSNKWEKLSEDQKSRFAPICPDFVIELKSEHDTLDDLKKKMLLWIANGVTLGWLIDYESQTTYIYRQNGKTQAIKGFDQRISGEEVLQGFELDLSQLEI